MSKRTRTGWTSAQVGQQHGHMETSSVFANRLLHLGNVSICEKVAPRLLELRYHPPLFELHELVQQALELAKVGRRVVHDAHKLGDCAFRKRLARVEMLRQALLQIIEDLGDGQEVSTKVAKAEGLVADVVEERDHGQRDPVASDTDRVHAVQQRARRRTVRSHSGDDAGVAKERNAGGVL
jgi:hypothetical protein